MSTLSYYYSSLREENNTNLTMFIIIILLPSSPRKRSNTLRCERLLLFAVPPENEDKVRNIGEVLEAMEARMAAW